jgi:hypothetical protein
MNFSLPDPDLQADFASALIQLREVYLQDALFTTVRRVSVAELDKQLSVFATADDLALLASKGLRGELLFATPLLMRENPNLLGYYRLLLGYSQKSFYTAETGMGAFAVMEKRGTLAKAGEEGLGDLCRALNAAASYLLHSITEGSLTRDFLDDLTLLTLGPQLRGGANVKKGARGIVLVFDAIREIVAPYITRSTPRLIEIVNAAGRKVLIEFAPDPDIIIREQLSAEAEDFRNIIAIEVKGGTDFSNIHNRVGEAEKSHQKAKADGYVECWTVVNVDRIDLAMARTESPSTNRFYLLSQIIAGSGREYQEFEARVVSLTGIPSRPKPSEPGA